MKTQIFEKKEIFPVKKKFWPFFFVKSSVPNAGETPKTKKKENLTCTV